MNNGEVLAVYIGLIRSPRRFVIHRKISADCEIFEVYKPRSLHEFVSKMLTALSSTQPDFMGKIAQLDDKLFQKSKHRTRHYIAKNQNDLYPESPKLTEKHSEQVLGYWVATNFSRKEVDTLATLACQAAGVIRSSISKAQL